MSAVAPSAISADKAWSATSGIRTIELLCRGGVVLVVLWLCTGSLAISMLNALAPAQRVIYAALMPEFSASSFGVEQVGPHLKLRVNSANTKYIVIRGRAYAPGIAFEAETPARVALVYVGLIIAGAALTIRRSVRAATAGAAYAVLACLMMAVVSPSVLLAGAQWGIGLTGFEEFSLPAVLVGMSAFLLHGGGYALSAAAVAFVASVGRQSARVPLPVSDK